MLPLSIQKCIAALLENQSKPALVIARQQLTGRYRNPPNQDHQPSTAGFASPAEALSYVATRFPATFAALEEALSHTSVPDVRSILDIGAGPGTAALAAALQWPGCRKIHLIEENAFISRLSENLLVNLPETAHISFSFQQANFLATAVENSYDLAILSYVLTELTSADQESAVMKAWQAVTQGVVIVVPGTPEAYKRLMAARTLLIEQGAVIAAPCPHNHPCPLPIGNWCHFSTRLSRPAFHREIKKGTLAYEDEKFSYLVALKEPLSSSVKQADIQANERVIRKPLAGTGHVTLDLCKRNGKISRQIVSKREKILYKKATKLKWGDCWEEEKLK